MAFEMNHRNDSAKNSAIYVSFPLKSAVGYQPSACLVNFACGGKLKMDWSSRWYLRTGHEPSPGHQTQRNFNHLPKPLAAQSRHLRDEISERIQTRSVDHRTVKCLWAGKARLTSLPPSQPYLPATQPTDPNSAEIKTGVSAAHP